MDRILSKDFPQSQVGNMSGEMASAKVLPAGGSTNWQAGLVVGIFIVLLAGLYHEVLVKLGLQWNNDPDYSHGFLVPVLVGYFVWERWDRLKAIPIVPSLWGIALLAGGLLLRKVFR